MIVAAVLLSSVYGMRLSMFKNPDCVGIRKEAVSWVFTDKCTSVSGFGSALTTCELDGKGKLEVSIFQPL